MALRRQELAFRTVARGRLRERFLCSASRRRVSSAIRSLAPDDGDSDWLEVLGSKVGNVLLHSNGLIGKRPVLDVSRCFGDFGCRGRPVSRSTGAIRRTLAGNWPAGVIIAG